MLHNLWTIVKRIFGLDGSWEMMTLARVGIDPVSARTLTRVLQPAHTIRLRPEPAKETDDEFPALRWHGITDSGLVRAHNEDSLALLDLGNDALFMVADGMGGHDAGEVASRIAIESVESTVREERGRNNDLRTLVRQAVQRANTAVREEAARRGSNMGTTLTVALVHDGTVYLANVGDSRAYWIKDGSLTRITSDHSLVQKLVDLGKLTKDEARTDPRSHLLLRSIGSEENVAVDTFQFSLSPGGTLLLCTDGLWGEVIDEDLRSMCSEEARTEVLCARLVQQANANGGKDNITAIVAKVV